MALVCQFVDSIAAAPTMRLNLNQSPWRTHKDTRFEYPQLRQSISSTMITDGAQIPASAYGLRNLHLVLQVDTPTVDETATELQKLIRELDRPSNFLKTQLGTMPVFFQTHRSSPDDWEIHTDGTFMTVVADVLAQPFGLGLQETPVSGITINTDPAAGNWFIDVTGVDGDVEAPAYIKWPSTAIAPTRETVFAVRRRGTPSAAPTFFQAEAMTQGTNTTTQPNDVLFSGAGNNFSRRTFPTTTLTTAISVDDVGTASVDLRGRYRVWVRVRKTVGTDTINLVLQWGDLNAFMVINNDPVATGNSGNPIMYDLGELNIPAGIDSRYDSVSGVELAVSDAFLLAVRAERLAGTGNLDLDFVKLVPADDRMAIVKWADDPATGSDHWILDAYDNSAHARDSSGRVISAAPPRLAGAFPMLSPNQTNRIYVIREVAFATHALTTISPVSVSYWPRYLSVRPATT